MAKYLVLWEADENKIPVDVEERKAGWLMAIEMSRQDINEGVTTDWGGFVGQTSGFSISEGTHEDVMKTCLKYIPFFRFKVIPFGSMDSVEAAIKAL
ncbi:MAG: hypothetical protein HN580_20190 [Deltaproteobacteria bacterium]|jgi:hypothetical protein|nr:hypothetical protein [Deltaproteobacteria bacterium]MBT4087055.1 hypothetical protein [Deltaproteobacteria bacterium]MBT4269385.1 hypothetical protein [Deltaproteobacteria bacterium]MBT4638678.1 hypothetical protein [Deltaproteobacteria bacterium]MBT6501895.1 hypothetical protein [Deltaproteobacteria bacterium]